MKLAYGVLDRAEKLNELHASTKGINACLRGCNENA
jgi:hypothetical protein